MDSREDSFVRLFPTIWHTHLVSTVDEPLTPGFEFECIDRILISPPKPPLNMPYKAEIELPELPNDVLEYYDQIIDSLGWFLEMWGHPLVLTVKDVDGDTEIRVTIEKV